MKLFIVCENITGVNQLKLLVGTEMKQEKKLKLNSQSIRCGVSLNDSENKDSGYCFPQRYNLSLVLVEKEKVEIPSCSVCTCFLFFLLESLDLLGHEIFWGGIIIYILAPNLLHVCFTRWRFSAKNLRRPTYNNI